MFSCIVSLLMCLVGGTRCLVVGFSGRVGLLLFGLVAPGFVWVVSVGLNFGGALVVVGGSLYCFLGFVFAVVLVFGFGGCVLGVVVVGVVVCVGLPGLSLLGFVVFACAVCFCGIAWVY